jgi:hypothetical protein
VAGEPRTQRDGGGPEVIELSSVPGFVVFDLAGAAASAGGTRLVPTSAWPRWGGGWAGRSVAGAGPLAGRSVVTCLLIAAGTQACAAATCLLTGPGRAGEPVPPRPQTASSE